MRLHQGACGRHDRLGDIIKKKKARFVPSQVLDMCEEGVARHVHGKSVKALSVGAKVSMLAQACLAYGYPNPWWYNLNTGMCQSAQ